VVFDDGLEVDTQCGAVFDHGLLEVGVDPGLGQVGWAAVA
jgi:hypothetical protein